MKVAVAACAVGLVSLVACTFPPLPAIVDDAGIDAPIDGPVCVANTTTCSDATLIVCDAEGQGTIVTCGFGCAASGDRCRDLEPSNGLVAFLDQARTAPSLTLTGNAVIDTSAGTVTDGDGSPVTIQSSFVVRSPVDLMVISTPSLDVANVTVRGSRALAIMVDGDAIVNGTLSISASQATSGPGALFNGGGPCLAFGGTQASDGTGGGGGGGYGSVGGAAGDGGAGQGGPGGAVNGTLDIIPLRGGCPGALSLGTTHPDPEDEQAGGAGGALQLSARGTIRIEPGAAITANGGGAKGWTGPFMICTAGQLSCGEGSGGGSGGAVLIEAARFTITSSSAVTANGGAGHCGFPGSAPDGTVSETPVPGTTCGNTIGNGGNGAAGALDGGAGTSGSRWGGGGGGGVGRIRINLPAGQMFDPGPPIVSPPPSVGLVQTR